MYDDDPQESQLTQADRWLNDAIDPSSKEDESENTEEEENEEGPDEPNK